jgi:hypothetical protein
MVDDVSAKVLSDLGHHGYEHYGAGRVDAVADGLFVRTGFWTVPDLASEITRAAAVTTVDTIRSVPHVDALLSQTANDFWWVINDGVDHLANFSTGFSDTLTVGGTRWFRGRYGMDYIDYDSLAYTGGQVTGAVVGFGLGFTGSAAAGGVLYSVARGYNAIETTVAVTQATRNLINGERNLGDALAFAPALGVAAKQLTKISGLLPRAGNAARGGFTLPGGGPAGTNSGRTAWVLDEAVGVAQSQRFVDRARRLGFSDEAISVLPNRLLQYGDNVGETFTGGWAGADQFLIGRWGVLSTRNQRIMHELGHVLDDVANPGLFGRAGQTGFGWRGFYNAERIAYTLQYGFNPSPLTAFNATAQAYPLGTRVVVIGGTAFAIYEWWND